VLLLNQQWSQCLFNISVVEEFDTLVLWCFITSALNISFLSWALYLHIPESRNTSTWLHPSSLSPCAWCCVPNAQILGLPKGSTLAEWHTRCNENYRWVLNTPPSISAKRLVIGGDMWQDREDTWPGMCCIQVGPHYPGFHWHIASPNRSPSRSLDPIVTVPPRNP
jgi:hypothetical protein